MASANPTLIWRRKCLWPLNKEGREIAVEIKSFLGLSALNDFENALGQYGMYRAILSLRDPTRVLYLAVPNTVREMLLDEKDMRYILRDFRVHLIFYDPLEEEELEWIEAMNSE